MALKTELCVEIQTRLLNDKEWVGSGYQVTDNLVLTAAHVVFGSEIGTDPDAPIVLGWRDEKDSDLVCNIEVRRETALVWFDRAADVDIAVLQFDPENGPGRVAAPINVIGAANPQPGAKWTAIGLSGTAADVGGNRAWTTPSGELPNIERQSPSSIQLSATHGDVPEEWGGCSGGPVAIGERIYGVLSAVRDDQQSGLFVSLIYPALQSCGAAPGNRTLAEVLGLPTGYRRQQAWDVVWPHIVECLGDAEKLRTAIGHVASQLGLDLASSGSATAIADGLERLSDDHVVDILMDCSQDDGLRADRQALSRFDALTRWWLSFWSGGEGQSASLAVGIRSAANGVVRYVVSDDIYGYLEIEGAMATADAQAPALVLQNDELRASSDWTPDTHIGLDEDGAEADRLYRDEIIHRTCPDPAAAEQMMRRWYESRQGLKLKDEEKDEDVRFLVGRHLRRAVRTMDRRPYIRVDDQEGFLHLSEWYQELAVINVTVNQDNEKRDIVRAMKTIIVDVKGRLLELEDAQ